MDFRSVFIWTNNRAFAFVYFVQLYSELSGCFLTHPNLYDMIVFTVCLVFVFSTVNYYDTGYVK